jgi:hypothetical protein
MKGEATEARPRTPPPITDESSKNNAKADVCIP